MVKCAWKSKCFLQEREQMLKKLCLACLSCLGRKGAASVPAPSHCSEVELCFQEQARSGRVARTCLLSLPIYWKSLEDQQAQFPADSPYSLPRPQCLSQLVWDAGQPTDQVSDWPCHLVPTQAFLCCLACSVPRRTTRTRNFTPAAHAPRALLDTVQGPGTLSS